MEGFRTPKKSIGDISADSSARLLSAAADITLIMDAKGVIKDLSVRGVDFDRQDFEDWIGGKWIETVTIESRQKIEDLLKDAAGKGVPKWRQVNHPSKNDNDIPVQYCAVQLDGRIVAFGRDLRGLAALQQRLVEAQQSMEREYARVRSAEARYRLLFQITSEPVAIVDGATFLVAEANPAAALLFGKPVKRLTGRSFPELFDAEGSKKIQALLNAVRAAGRSEPISASITEGKRGVHVGASSFRHEGGVYLLVQLSAPGENNVTGPHARLADVVDSLPDGFVVTGSNRHIISANAAFLDMVQLASPEQVVGEQIDKWLGRHAVEINVLFANLRDHGSVRHFATVLRGEYDATEEVEVSAVAVTEGDEPCYGFTIRGVTRRPTYVVNGHRDLPRSVEQLTQLVGRVTLKELVRESTDVIERLCIEAALELTGDNRASAADILGLSRQSLYSKLRRHGLGDLDPGVGA